MSIRHRINTVIRRYEKPFATYNRIEVARSALRHNARLFAELTGLPVMPVLKGDAYGHGIALAAQALEPDAFPYLAVDGYFEALRVRQVYRRPVLVMGAIRPENFARMDLAGFAFAVQHAETIEALAATGRKVNIHLEVNTGMNRYGVKPQEIAAFTKRILAHRKLHLEGIMTHLADADGPDPRTVTAAVRLFDQAVEAARSAGAQPEWCHIAQTAGSALVRSHHANAIRLGIGLYGINPFPPDHIAHHQLSGLRPALKLISTVTNTIELQKGDQVSYNYTFTAPRAMRLGVLPLGYYEGVNRALSNTGVVKVGESYRPIVGRVCMNHTMIDLSGVNAGIGDEVVVYSDDPRDRNGIDAIARAHGLFNYNLLTALSHDVRRILVK